jgi:hypothetical protein
VGEEGKRPARRKERGAVGRRGEGKRPTRGWAPAFGQPSEKRERREGKRAGPRVRGGKEDFSRKLEKERKDLNLDLKFKQV